MTKSELLRCFDSFSWYGKPTEDKRFDNYQMIIFLSDTIVYTHDNPHSIIATLPKIDSALIDEYDIMDCDVTIRDSSLVLLCKDVPLSTIHSIVSDFIEFHRNDNSSSKTNNNDLYNFYETRIKKEKEFMSNIERDEEEQNICPINSPAVSITCLGSVDDKKLRTVYIDRHFPIYDRLRKDLPKCNHEKCDYENKVFALSLLYDVMDYCSNMIDSLSHENFPETMKGRCVRLEDVCDLTHFMKTKIDVEINVVLDSTIDEEKTIHPVEISIWANKRLIITRKYNKDADGLYDIIIPC